MSAAKRLEQLFTEHPAAVDETYTEHMQAAGCFGFKMIAGGLACLIHAVFPWLHEFTGSRIIVQLNETMVEKRNKKTGARSPGHMAAPAQLSASVPRDRQ